MDDHRNPKQYDVRISDEQRHYLIVALAQCQMQGYYGADASGREEVDALHDMLSDDKGLVPVVSPLAHCTENTLNDFTA